MKGLEIARAYYEEYGEPMLREKFPGLMPFIAAGLTGSGSECWGFDDEISRDHDFEPGFCLFLPGEDIVDRRTAFALERAYAALPKEFMGLRRSLVSPVGGARHGVLRTAEFMRDKVGKADGNLSLMERLYMPDYILAEAVNGEIFMDGYGEVTAIRERLRHQPEDVRLKKLAGQLLLMGQSGQYNYRRCLSHGETRGSAAGCSGICQKFDGRGLSAEQGIPALLQVEFPGDAGTAQAGAHGGTAGVSSDHGQRGGHRRGKI